MEWLGDLLGGAATVASGGVLGLVGSIFGKVGQYFTAKQEYKEAQAEREHELKLLDKQHQFKSQEDMHEVAMLETAGSYTGLEASLRAEAVTGNVSQWVNNIRSLTRPALTFALVAILAWIFVALMSAIQSSATSALTDLLGQEAVVDILKYIIYSAVFSATTAVVWWFGDRALTPPNYRSR